MKKILSFLAMALLPALAFAFSVDKYYAIHRNGEASSYIYQDGTTMRYGAFVKNNPAYVWQLIPTGQPDVYQIRNVGSEQYIQSSATTLSSLVGMGDAPVEYLVSHGANTARHYFLASNDQTIDYTTDSTLGLNKGASGVVAYYIKTGRGNSYWEIEETDYNPDDNTPVTEDDDVSPNVSAYRLPCGTYNAKTYFSQLNIEGEGVLGELHYKAAAPGNRYVVYTAQRIVVARGGEVNLKGTLEGYTTTGLNVTVYADFDGDARFEQTVNVGAKKNVEATLTVPVDTKAVMGRIRVRVDKSGSVGANADVYGVCYDFPVYFGDSDGQRVLTLQANSAVRGTAVIEGLNESVAKYERGAEVKVRAIANKGYRFSEWRQCESVLSPSKGIVVGSTAVYTTTMTENKTLTAVFVPTNEDDSECIRLEFRNTHVGPVEIFATDQDGNVFEGITADVTLSPEQWIKDTGTAMASATELTPNSSRDKDMSRFVTLSIKGLPNDFGYESIRARIAAVSTTGNFSSSTNATSRPYTFIAYTGSSVENLTQLAQLKNANIMIDGTPDAKDNTHGWMFTGEECRPITDPLCIRLEMINLGGTASYSSLFGLDIMKSDKTPVDGVSEINAPASAPTRIYDLKGYQVKRPASHGVYITSDGRKVVK